MCFHGRSEAPKSPLATCRLYLQAYDVAGVSCERGKAELRVEASGPEPKWLSAEMAVYKSDASGLISFTAPRLAVLRIDGNFSSPPMPQTISVPDLEECDLSVLVKWG